MKKTILLLTAIMMLFAIGCGKQNAAANDPDAVFIDPNALRGGEYGDLYFEANGVRFGIFDEADEVFSKLPKETGSHTSESCAFDNADVAHFFPSFEITTNEIDGVDRITAIQIKDDLIKTPQGLYIGMSEADAAEAFPKLRDAGWNLIDGTALLSVAIVDGTVAAISYTPAIAED